MTRPSTQSRLRLAVAEQLILGRPPAIVVVTAANESADGSLPVLRSSR